MLMKQKQSSKDLQLETGVCGRRGDIQSLEFHKLKPGISLGIQHKPEQLLEVEHAEGDMKLHGFLRAVYAGQFQHVAQVALTVGTRN